MLVPSGGAVLSEWIVKTPNVPSPSSATEVGLQVLELGVGRVTGSIDLQAIVKDLVSSEMSYLTMSDEVFTWKSK